MHAMLLDSVILLHAEENRQPQCVWLPAQSPSKGRRGRPAAEPDAAQLQLAGVLHIMKMLGSSQGGGGEQQQAERPLHPEIVYHIVDGLIDQCAPALSLPSTAASPADLPGVLQDACCTTGCCM